MIEIELIKEEAKKEIQNLIDVQEEVYPSEIAEKLKIDLALVFEIINELKREGKITDE